MKRDGWAAARRRAVLGMSAACFAMGMGLVAAPASANPVGAACLRSGLDAANAEICGCVAMAAEMTLSARDQRQAAGFYTDPHRAQEIRMSDRRADSQFWDRYQRFGQVAEDMCG